MRANDSSLLYQLASVYTHNKNSGDIRKDRFHAMETYFTLLYFANYLDDAKLHLRKERYDLIFTGGVI